MLLCLSSLNGDEDEKEEEGEEWTNMIDRGGLLHINYDTYTLLYIIEEEVHKHLTTDKLHKQRSDNKDIDYQNCPNKRRHLNLVEHTY